MKQIFDWMRKKPLKAFEVYDGSIGVYPCEINRLIDEAEAKWESECCEWKWDKEHHRYETSCEYTSQPHNYNFCPYCGKIIKIWEVEHWED